MSIEIKYRLYDKQENKVVAESRKEWFGLSSNCCTEKRKRKNYTGSENQFPHIFGKVSYLRPDLSCENK
jgi:hypothetical protein